MRLVIWTRAYRPFTMGGDVNRPIATEVAVGKPITLVRGRPQQVYVVLSPNGHEHVAEAATGALVGTSLAEVLQDYKEADDVVVQGQLADAAAEAKRAELLSPDEFWRLFQDER